MPITDYSKTIMYKIVCNDLNVNDCYVGHTINMPKRKCSHKSRYNNEKDKHHNLKIYQIIRENGGWSNWSMLLVEKFQCKDKYEACKREREIFEELGAKMNTRIPYITKEETKQYYQENKQQFKQYYQENKEELKKYQKEYDKKHREENKEYAKKYREEKKAEMNKKIECEFCSKLISKRNMTRHHKTCKSKE